MRQTVYTIAYRGGPEWLAWADKKAVPWIVSRYCATRRGARAWAKWLMSLPHVREVAIHQGGGLAGPRITL